MARVAKVIAKGAMFKPMLAPQDDPLKNPNFFRDLKFPLLVSPKLDGIRCVVRGSECLSRKLLPLPSNQVHDMFSGYESYDGELIVGSPTAADCYNRTQSHVMSRDKPSDELSFHVFDITDEDLACEPFSARLNMVSNSVMSSEWFGSKLHIVPHVHCYNLEDLLEQEEYYLSQGYEGVIMRNPNGHYKWGRGTFKEGLIYKLKRFQDDEATITGFVEEQTNMNDLEEDNLGHAKRSTKQEGMMGANTLGKIIANFNGVEISVAPGVLTHKERRVIWDNQSDFLYKTIKFRHFPHGKKDLPRQPRFSGFRDSIDL